jgi:hypothetical protein
VKVEEDDNNQIIKINPETAKKDCGSGNGSGNPMIKGDR